MKKPKAPKNGGGLASQQNYKKRLEDYTEWKKLRDSNSDKARKL